MFIFNNTNILKSGSDIALGAVYVENENFNFDVFKRLIRDKIWELIDSYVDDRLRNTSKSDNISEEDVLADLAMVIKEKLYVPVDYGDISDLVIAITTSDSFSRFMANMKEGFSFYENTISATEYPVPVSNSDSNMTEKQKEFFSSEAVESVMNETSIIDFIETLGNYGVTELY